MKPGRVRMKWSAAARLGRWGRAGCLGMMLIAGGFSLPAQSLSTAFEVANKFYEQGKFTEAAAAYEKLLQSNRPSATLYFNLGNACFKAGQNGRAIAAYRQGQQLAPRDPNVRFNLEFVRKRVTGREALPDSFWRRWLAALTLNEWTVLAAVALWLWGALLAAREARPALRPALSGYTATAGALTLLLGGCLALAGYARFSTTSAVVTVAEAVVRNGPLDDSPVAYQLRDGSEALVLDQIEVADQPTAFTPASKQVWIQVQTSGRRVGWLKRDQVAVLNF